MIQAMHNRIGFSAYNRFFSRFIRAKSIRHASDFINWLYNSDNIKFNWH